MSTPNDSDLLLVERSGVQYHLSYEDMSTLNDDDLLLVERSGTQYKIEAQYVSTGPTGYFDTPVEVLTPLNGAGLNEGESYEPFSTAIVSESNGVITFTDDTELSNIIGPVKMVDANGDVKTPVTSAVTSTSVTIGEAYFSTTAYVGSGVAGNQVSTGVDNTGKALIWIKNRDIGDNHVLFDSERGANASGEYYKLYSSNNSDQVAIGTSLTSFNSDGFTTGGVDTETNSSGHDIVAWNFKVAAGFFDIQTFVGTGAPGKVVPHDLSADVGMMIVKNASDSENWRVWHKALNNTRSSYLVLNTSDGEAFNTAAWDFTAPTSTDFYVGQHNETNGLNDTIVAYLFADGAMSKCGSYQGTGGTSTPEVACGFEPGWVMIKAMSAGSWVMYDVVRDPTGTGENWLYANSTSTEQAAATYAISTSATGFTPYGTSGENNGSGQTYIFLAIAKEAKASDVTELTLSSSTDLSFFTAGDAVSGPGEKTFSTTLYTGDDASYSVVNGINNSGSGGLVWIKSRNGGGFASDQHRLIDTERGRLKALSSDTAVGETTTSDPYPYLDSFNNDGYTVGYNANVAKNGITYVAWNFKVAPKFFDIQTYTGDDTDSRIIPHDLDSDVGMLLIKSTTLAQDWVVVHKDIPSDTVYPGYVKLNENNASFNGSENVIPTYPTNNSFSVGPDSKVNSPGIDYVAYLFADTPGLIKCGSYLANAGQDATESVPFPVNVGFKPQWVLIKNTTVSPSSWLLIDDKKPGALFADLSNKESTSSWLEFTESGFNVILGNAAIYSEGSTYIYVAIAKFAPASGEVVSVDVANKKLEVTDDGSAWQVGDIATGPALNTVANNVTSQTGDTLTVSGVTGNTGNWVPGLYAEGATITRSAPSASSIVFTTSNDGTTPVTGVDATLVRRFWTLESSSSSSGPFTSVGTYEDTAANSSQDGSAPWTTHPALQADTFYQVKVKYESLNAEAVESLFNTFKTAP